MTQTTTTLTYSLENAGTSHFDIARANGQLLTGAPLDYETRSSYTVKVIATDPSGATDSITVTINVNNIDEPGTVTLYWNQPQVNTPLEATLTDPDGSVSGVTWSWRRSSNGSTWTAISGANLSSYTPASGDADTYLQATASYTDGEGGSKTARAAPRRRVRTVPSSNSAPEFTQYTDTDLYVKRTAPVGTKLYNALYAQDPDRDEVRYSLDSTGDAEFFDILAFTGHVVTKVSLLDADKSEYTVTVRARDPSDDSNTTAVTITAGGSTETPVVMGPKEIRYSENGSWQVATYTATNPRGPIRGWIIGVNPGGGDGDFFDIDDDGVLTFESPPDYETPMDDNGDNQYSFTIMAYDTNPPQGQRPAQAYFSVKVTVTDVDEPLEVTVTDVNEAPEFPSTETGARTIAENTAAGQNIGAPVAATDPDTGDTLTYTLGGDDAASFDIVASSGQLQTKAALDHETKDTYTVTVSVSDEEGTDGNADTTVGDTITVTITVTDENEAPAFAGEPDTRTVAENTDAGEDVGAPVAATDPDTGDTLAYTLGGDDAGSFDIVPSSGQLRTKATLDHETKDTYSVTVTATDPSNTSDTIAVTITVTDVDEAGTVVLSSVQPQVETALTATLTDPDGNISDDTWSWESSSDRSSWAAIGGATSKSYTPVAGDVGSYLRVTASYTDGEGSGKNAQAVSDNTVRAAPASNSAPEFAAETASRTIAENTPPDENVGTPVTATDADNDSLTYTLSGTDAESFGIVPSSGQLRTKATLDYETKPGYAVIVTATDPSNAFDNIAVTITVTDVSVPGQPATPTVEATSSSSLRVTWNAPGTGGAPTGYDVEYRRKGGDGQFTKRSTSGSRSLSINGLEPSTTYEVQVRARNAEGDGDWSDLGSGRTRDNVSQNKGSSPQGSPSYSSNSGDSDSGDRSNREPEFTEGRNATRSVTEHAAAETNIGQPVAATDADKDTLTYTLGGDDAASFAIVSSSGQLRTKASLDYETKDTYSVTVTATDPSNTPDTITVTITVTDEDEAPVVTGQSTVDYAENGIGIVATYAATDPENGQVTWSLSGEDGEDFSISNTGVLTFKASPDYEAPADGDTDNEYIVTLQASDVTMTGVLDVTVTVTDENETPVVTGQSAVDYAENGSGIVATYAATDPEGASLTWSLSGEDGDDFSISNTGALTFKALPDYEAPADDNNDNEYVVIVQASNRIETGALDITITVTDEDEAPVVTGQSPGETGQTEEGNKQPGEVDYEENGRGAVIIYTAADPEGASLTWSLSGEDSDNFSISDTGVLTFRASPSYESPTDDNADNVYVVTVQVSDGTSTSELDITITVTDENEAPQFPSAETGARSVAENTPAGRNLGVPVAATEPDTGDTLTYTLGGADAPSFDIVASSGQLQTKAALDYETKDTYTVTVSVHDGKDTDGNADTTVDDTIAVTVTVTNEDEAGRVVLSSVQPQVDTRLTATLEDPDDAISAVAWSWESSSDRSVWDAIGGETSNSYTPVAGDVGSYLRVTASYTDGEGPGKAAQTVSASAVRAAPSTNSAPEFATDTDTRTVAENTAAGQNIGQPVAASDADNDTLTYSLGGDDAASFDIVPSSGQLQTKAPLDHETKSSYTVTVTATDPSSASDTVAVSIAVTDVDEAPVVSGTTPTDYTEKGAVPGGASITRYPPGGDNVVFSTSNPGELTSGAPLADPKAAVESNTASLSTEKSRALLLSAIMMAVGALTMGAGAYILIRLNWIQHRFRQETRPYSSRPSRQVLSY